MSGYRSLHREQLLLEEGVDAEEVPPFWQLQCMKISLESSSSSILLSASADGFIRVHRVCEKTSNDVLNASAMHISCTHILLGINHVFPATEKTLLGCSQCQMIRNYVGSDEMAGDIVIVGLEFTGRIRVWKFEQDALVVKEEEEGEAKQQQQIRCKFEFVIENATGTMMAVCPPHVEGDLTTAVACLDGSIAIVALGIGTPNMKKEATPAGTILRHLGTVGSSIALSLQWHPSQPILVVGRIDGIVDIIPATQKKGHHRITHHSQPVRAISYTKDGTMLITGSDDGFLAVWDLQRRTNPIMVHHVVQAHVGWIIGICTLRSDSRRFVTAGADRKNHVWQFDQMQYAPTHTFQSDGDVRTICTTTTTTTHTKNNNNPERLYSASDKGWIQVFSLD